MGLKAVALPEPTAAKLPRWRGFNLEEKKDKHDPVKNAPYQERDFAYAAEWGFDFIRLPVDYRIYVVDDDPMRLSEPALKEIDQAVEWGKRYGQHVNLNLHRIPGFTVNHPAEPRSLWTDEGIQRAAAFHWTHFATRYRGIPNRLLSFNLLNEPWGVDGPGYRKVVKLLCDAVRSADPDRLIVADGLNLGFDAVPDLADLGIAQSLHAYMPYEVSHHKAEWFGRTDWPAVGWPMTLDGKTWDRESLRRDYIAQWKALEAKGVGVHASEFGTYRNTPHHVTLAYMKDFLDLFRETGWGWAIWNLRGAYGVLDSHRADVAYDEFRGHRLDRRMLELLRAY